MRVAQRLEVSRPNKRSRPDKPVSEVSRPAKPVMGGQVVYTGGGNKGPRPETGAGALIGSKGAHPTFSLTHHFRLSLSVDAISWICQCG